MGNKLKAISKISVALALLGAAVPAVEAAPTAMAAKKATKKAKKSTKKVVKKSTKKAKKAKKTTKKVAKKTAAKKPAKKAVKKTTKKSVKKAVKKPVAKKSATKAVKKPVSKKPATKAVKKPVSKKPATKAAKKPVSKKPATKAVKKPVAKKPATKVVKKTTTKKPANKAVKHVTMADKYQPKVKSGTVNVKWGTDLYEDGEYDSYPPKDFITNKSSLPEDVVFDYLDDIDTRKAGTYKTRIEAHYSDGSEEVVGTVTFVVSKSDADKYQPTVKDVTLNWGESFDPRDAITNAPGYFPKDTEFYYGIDGFDEDYEYWDFNHKSGTYNAQIEVKYPDGSSEETKKFKITVLPSDADKAKLSLKSSNFTVSSSEILGHGDTLNDPTRFLNIGSALPEGTTIMFKRSAFLYYQGSDIKLELGKHETSLVIYFPDGSEYTTDKFTVDVKTDAEIYKAKVSLKSSNFTVSSNETLEHKTDDGYGYTLNDPTRFLNIGSALPKGTLIAFDDVHLDSADKPDPGKYETSLRILFPDYSEYTTDKFTVNVK